MKHEESIWQSSDSKVSSLDDQIHIWLADLEVIPGQIQLFWEVLSEDEKQKAGRFVFASDRNNYIASRGILRALIGKYLNMDPGELRFSYTLYGKPFLEGSSLKFNISHSGKLALFGFVLNDELGIDIEKIRNNFDLFNLAEQFFSKQEISELKLIPESERQKAFFNCWTRKEAYIKAQGEGLSISLDSFNVPVLLPGDSDMLMPVKCEGTKDTPWMLKSLDTDKMYCAALALRRYYREIKCWKWHYEVSWQTGE